MTPAHFRAMVGFMADEDRASGEEEPRTRYAVEVDGRPLALFDSSVEAWIFVYSVDFLAKLPSERVAVVPAKIQ